MDFNKNPTSKANKLINIYNIYIYRSHYINHSRRSRG